MTVPNRRGKCPKKYKALWVNRPGEVWVADSATWWPGRHRVERAQFQALHTDNGPEFANRNTLDYLNQRQVEFNDEDSDGDGPIDGVEIHFQEATGTNPLLYQVTLIMLDDNGNPESLIYPYTGWIVGGTEGTDYRIEKAQSDDPNWAPLANELAPILIFEDMNQEYPTSIFFDSNRDMSDNGIPKKIVSGEPVYAYLEDGGGATLDGYYEKSFSEMEDIATVYMNVKKDGHLLGIQYWFYYVDHDCPKGNNVHQHEWWYFWLVYDTASNEPKYAYYDFHHIVTPMDWDDIYTDGFHPKVWIDGGGHRHLMSGYYNEISYTIPTNAVQEVQTIIEDYVGFSISLVNVKCYIKVSGSLSQDVFFDLMLFWLSGAAVFPEFEITYEWRLYAMGQQIASASFPIYTEEVLEIYYGSRVDLFYYIVEDISGFDIPIPQFNVLSDWREDDTHFDAGQTMYVEDWDHWVYVYNTDDREEKDDSIEDQQYVVVRYTGDNIYDNNEDHSNRWPAKVNIYFRKDQEYKWYKSLPWLISTDSTLYEAWDWSDPNEESEVTRDKEYQGYGEGY